MYYLASAFALSMLPGSCRVVFDPLTDEQARDYLPSYIRAGLCKSVVGHASTARVIEAKLGVPVEANRESVRLSRGDSVYVFQVGTRLQEGQVLSADELKAVPTSWWVATVM
jgi:hypothetical protein